MSILAKERLRRRIVSLVFVVFWILIFEGSLRKWVAPEASRFIYFLRDPFVIAIYFLALRGNFFRRAQPFLAIGLLVAGVAFLFSILNLAGGHPQYNPILALYGMRNYFFNLPLAFVIARVFERDDLGRLARSSILAICIAAPLAALQFNSPPNSIVNSGIAEDEDLQFKNLAQGSGKVRPAGTFTSAVGMTHLTVSSLAILMWLWIKGGAATPVKKPQMILGFLAVATAIAVSGSRTTFVHSFLVIAMSMSVSLILRGGGNRARALVLPAAVLVLFSVLYPIVYPEAFQAFSDRWTDANKTEGRHFEHGAIVGRSMHSFIDFVRLFDQMPFFGYGVGIAGNAAVMMGVKINGLSVLALAEEDWSRHVVELGPPLAVLFILYRISFGVWLGLRVLRAVKISNDPLPAMLFVYVVVALVQGQITGHGITNGFGWLYVGFCMASVNVAVARTTLRREQQTIVPYIAAPLFSGR